MNKQIKTFLDDKANRHKDVTANLGVLQTFVTLSNKYKYDDIIEPYIDEQLDRQVFWILNEIPELDFEAKKMKGK